MSQESFNFLAVGVFKSLNYYSNSMTQDILLLNPQVPGEKRTYPPLGIAQIAGYAIEHGYGNRVKIVDGQYLAQKYGWHEAGGAVKKEIEGGEIKVFGTSVHQGNVAVPLAFSMMSRIRGLDTILGGHYATLAHKSLAEYVTAIVRGDGEITSKGAVGCVVWKQGPPRNQRCDIL